jgi:uncharacterized protein with WD repeat
MRFGVLSEQQSCEVVACSLFNKEQAVCEPHAGTQQETHPYHSVSSRGRYIYRVHARTVFVHRTPGVTEYPVFMNLEVSSLKF